VDQFIATLAPRCGLMSIRRGQTTRNLHWQTPVASMRRLIPDSGLRAAGRVVWVDAKYKAHLQLLAHKGWDGLSEAVRESHRADLHQALAYTALDEATRVDSVLVYPELASTGAGQPAVATLPAGRRRLRLLLLGLPFGFRSEDHRQDTLARWCAVLAG
jgi:5-methylcytosine-specific restriction endonuclease McrBC regulatory subunit McrC